MKTQVIQARLADGSLAMMAGANQELPDEIQWMPPGTQTVMPTVDGKPKSMTITVDESLAGRLASELERLRAAAAAGDGDEPFLDFDHADGAAAAHVTALRWGGDDPRSGGIRASVTWTQAGRDAITGRTYRRFSPQWFADPGTGDPVGIGVNLGGLVNRAAFKRIAPVIAKDGKLQRPFQMDEQQKQELSALIAAAVGPISARLDAIEAKAKEAVDGVAAAENRVKALEASRTEGVLTAARARVNALAAEGKLPPGDKDGLEALAKAIADNPAVEAVVAKLQPNAAFRQVTQPGAGAGSGAAGGAGDGGPADFPAAMAAAKAAGAKTRGDALVVAMKAHPDLYRAWVQKGGLLSE